MNVDAQFPQAPVAAPANRPQPAQAGQTTTRPVDKAEKDASTDNRTEPDARQTEAQKATTQAGNETDRARREAAERRTDTGKTAPEAPNRSPARSFQSNSRDSEPVGELLDVLA